MSNILQEIESDIADLKTGVTRTNVGTVREIGDGVAKVEGLSDVMLNEMISPSVARWTAAALVGSSVL